MQYWQKVTDVCGRTRTESVKDRQGREMRAEVCFDSDISRAAGGGGGGGGGEPG